MRKPLCATILILTVWSAAIGESPETSPAPEVTEGVEEASTRLEEAAGSPDEEVLSILRTLAEGDPQLPETRDASFSLARALVRIKGWEYPEIRQVATSVMVSFPEDPRTTGLLLRLIDMDSEAGDRFGAHLLYRYLNTPDFIHANPVIAARSIHNAVELGDYAAAFNWSQYLDINLLHESTQPRTHLDILRAAQGVERIDIAIGAARELLSNAPEKLRINEPALLAAARSFETMGFNSEAILLYEWYINIHASSPNLPSALLSIARLAVYEDRTKFANEMYDLLIEATPDSPAALHGRLDRLEMTHGPTTLDQLPLYLEAARAASGRQETLDAFNRLLERFIGAGYPLEAISTVGAATRPDDGTLFPMFARRSMSEGLEAAIALLQSRKDNLGVAAVVAEANASEVPIPESQSSVIHAARTSLGLEPDIPDSFDESLDSAWKHFRDEDWDEAGRVLELTLSGSDTMRHTRRLEAISLLAEVLWRTRREAEALVRIKQALLMTSTPAQRRPFIVLRADILFSVGRMSDSCNLYQEAGKISDTKWVERQLDYCATVAKKPEETEKQG